MTNCGCTRPLLEGWNLCKTCRNELEKAIAETKALDDELTISLTRDHGIDYRTLGGSRSNNTQLPWDERISRARTALKTEYIGWVRILAGTNEMPLDRLTTIAAWLYSHLNEICRHDQAWDIYNGITRRSQACWQLVFHKPADRIYLGPCDGKIIDESDGRLSYYEEMCDGEIWNLAPNPEGACDQCGRNYDAAEKRAELNDRLADHLFTAAEVGWLAHKTFGQPRTKVENIVNKWANRGRIVAHSHTARGTARFRYADVLELLTETYGATA